MMKLLARRFKEKRLLDFFSVILGTYHTKTNAGLPVGNLVSQHLANFYLGLFDHWIKEEKGIRGYIRYMDDFLVFGHDQDRLKHCLDEIRDFLKINLNLDLKDNTQLNRCEKGIPFLGYRVFPGKIRLLRASKKRFSIKFRRYERRYAKGLWSELELARHMEPLIAFTVLSDSKGFRNGIINRFGVMV